MTERLKPNPDLMNPPQSVLEAPATFAACLNAHGLYNTLQFALRLSPKIHQLLDAVASEIVVPEVNRRSRATNVWAG